jgi:hypothetical protein
LYYGSGEKIRYTIGYTANSRARRILYLKRRYPSACSMISEYIAKGVSFLMSFTALWALAKLVSTAQGQCCLISLLLIFLHITHKHLLGFTRNAIDYEQSERQKHDPGGVDVIPDCFNELILPTLFSRATARDWILDSGAMSHVTGREDAFTHLLPPPSNTRIIGVGGATEVTGQGPVAIPITVDDVDKVFTIDNVLYTPGLPFNIISIKKLCLYPNGSPTDIAVSFTGPICKITRRSTEGLIAVADAVGPSLYKLRLQKSLEEHTESIYATTLLEETSMYTWHRRLGHLKESRLRRLLKDILGFTFPTSESLPRCEPCFRAMLRRMNYKTPGKRTTRPLERIFVDVGGPVRAIKGNKIVMRYWLVIVDDYSRYR